jgi:pimeloyl-ACP methyl ester carboxylesterase
MIRRILEIIITLLVPGTAAFSQSQSGYADVNATSLYYEVSGKGTPIVFIHGVFCDTRNWEKQVNFFSTKYKVICYDARGYGKSALPDSIHPYYQFEDLKNLLDYLGIDKAILVGHSMGGVIAMDFALHYPERVLALILPEGGSRFKGVWDSDPEALYQLKLPWIKLKLEGIQAGQNAFLQIPMIQISLKNKIAENIIRKMTLESPGWKWQLSNKQTPYVPDSIGQLKKLRMPALLMYGELSPTMYYIAMKTFAEYMPNSKLVSLKNASHCLNLENPDDFNSLVMSFLTEVKTSK